MKIPTRTQDRGFAFNITPLIDVVFLLIIFFLVASHFIRNENVERIELPLASQGKDDDEHHLNIDESMHREIEILKIAGTPVAMRHIYSQPSIFDSHPSP